MIWALGLLIVVAVVAMGYIRLAADDPTLWHVDPAETARTGKPNDFLVSPEGGDRASPKFDLSPAALMDKIRQVALAEPRTTLLGDRDGFMTFVQRSSLMGYPDYISVKAEAVDGGSALYLYSRSRYGHSDLGVNKARVLRWLEKL